MKILSYIRLIIAISFGISCSSNAQNVTSILDKAANVFATSNGITVDFALQSRGGGVGGNSASEGIIDLKGDKFVLQTPDVITWYDGKTQWTFVEHNEEVSVTSPSGEDLLLTNPMILLKSYKKNFTATLSGESTASNGKSAWNVVLTPKRKGDIEDITLQIEKTSYLPASIDISAKNGVRSIIKINKVKTGVNQADSYFVFDENKYPDAEVIDLR